MILVSSRNVRPNVLRDAILDALDTDVTQERRWNPKRTDPRVTKILHQIQLRFHHVKRIESLLHVKVDLPTGLATQ